MTDAPDTNALDPNVVRDDLLARFAAQNGGTVSELQKVQVVRALQLMGLASRERNRAYRGDPVDMGEWLRLEGLAGDAIAALNIPAAMPKPVQALKVEFIESPSHPENERLQERIGELERELRVARAAAAPVAPVVVTPAEPSRGIVEADRKVVALRPSGSCWGFVGNGSFGVGNNGAAFSEADPSGRSSRGLP